MAAGADHSCADFKKRVLVVCTANVCRSPYVASLLQQRIRAAGLDDRICVESAGVQAQPGREVDPTIRAMLEARQIPPADQYAKPVVEDDLRKADLVLVMEEAHRQLLFYRLPGALSKIFLLSELAGRYQEIDDPHGAGLEEYLSMAALVDELLEQGWPQLLKRLGIETHQ
ncbi:arsenate reductase/protein-tyrosine-phosphatase family protein [Caldilinea sp.]|jgi:protein-tyrosine phosphatase|uniref:arsenate reductase/protein-tyrosine-phosphatase family protein n=1 Tax=Caldilinea sp. TaxID=2293560 RepID=UPI00261EB5F6|nr:hypothetical protein [uncultured Caldilinea sp.]